MSNIINFDSEINWDLFKLGKSGRQIKLYYNKSLVCFQTSSLYTPFGVNSYSNQWSDIDTYTINCSFLDTNNKDKFTTFFNKLDEKIKTLVYENLDLFNIVDESVITYCSMYKKQQNKSTNYPALINLNFKRDTNGNFSTIYYNENSEQVILTESNISELIPKKSCFKTILSINKISFYNNSIYINIVIDQIKKNIKNKSETSNSSNDFTKLLIVDDD